MMKPCMTMMISTQNRTKLKLQTRSQICFGTTSVQNFLNDSCKQLVREVAGMCEVARGRVEQLKGDISM